MLLIKYDNDVVSHNSVCPASGVDGWGCYIEDPGVLTFMEMASTTFNCNSSSSNFYLLPPTLKENELLRGVKTSRILLFSTDIISSGLRGSFSMTTQLPSFLGMAFQNSSF
jgi:hypothetical protein